MEILFAMDCGADFVAQLFWLGEDGDPIAIQSPCVMEMRDAVGHVAMTFQTGVAAEDLPNQPAILIDGQQGFMQISVPRSLTARLTPGRYVADCFATLDDPGPFNDQVAKAFSGYVQVNPSVTTPIPSA